MEPGLRQRGYHMVSPAHRLGPQITLEEQVQDCVDSIAWCREHLPRILGADKVDVDRYVICGESAGGTLVALLGHKLDPPPKAIIEAYGVVDFFDKHFGVLDKSPKLDDQPPWEGEFTEEQLHAELRDQDPSHCLTDALSWDEQQRCSEEQLSQLWATDFKYTRAIRLRAELHIYRSTRLSISSAFQREKFSSDEELSTWLSSVSAILLLDGKTTYPPTAFLHGIDDTAVPLAQSQRLAEKLKEIGVPTVECYEHGPHVFDNVYKVRRGERHR
jgi:acetyl esterase/lipase